MDLDDVDFATLEDPAPKSKSNSGAPSLTARSAPKKSLKRKLLYRADVNPDGRRYKGRKVTRENAELDRHTLGLLDDDSEEEQDAYDDSASKDVVGRPLSGSRSEEEEDNDSPNGRPAAPSDEDGGESDADSASGEEDIGDPDLFVVDDGASPDDFDGSSEESARSNEESSDRDNDDASKPTRGKASPGTRRASLVDEERAITKRLTEVKEKDEQRASAVKDQMITHDAVLGLRIRMEPLLKNVRLLSTSEHRKQLPESKSPELVETRRDAEKQLLKLVNTTQTALDRLWPSEEVVAGRTDAKFDQWRDNVMDRWNRKLNEANGKVPKGGFKVLDLSVSSAIRSTLETDKPRARVQRVKEPLSLAGGAVVPPGEWEYHFDDAELYRNLLRDVIESGDANDRSLQYAKVGKSGRGKKRLDVSYAKGKRLKYDVMDKLVGFIAPVPAPDPGPVDEILANLFGKQGVVKTVEY